MNEMKIQAESGGHREASLTIELVVLVYQLKAERIQDFKIFYDKEIRAWFAENYVAHANSWIVGDRLFVVSSSPMRPWSSIPGLKEYVEQIEPVPAQALPKYHISAPLSTGSYAAD